MASPEDRKTEIRHLLSLSPEEVQRRAGDRLVVCEDIDALHQRMAHDIAAEIQAHNAAGEPSRLILPVGPTGQYPILARLIHDHQISLANSWFFFMDEYCDDAGQAFDADHPLSFKRQAEKLFFSQLSPACGLQPTQVFFPDENNIDVLATVIHQIHGLDTCFGGIGIHGHLAFNEPEPGVKESGPRRVRLNDFTVTINVVRGQVGGNLEGFPRYAYTLGMQEILGAQQIRLYCRNGCEFDWANTVLRLALFGSPGDDYPVTHIRHHNYVIVTDRETLASPTYLL
jgi:glucosamine-6-phosphate deaminase